MPSIKTIAMTVAIVFVALFLSAKFAPQGVKDAIGQK